MATESFDRVAYGRPFWAEGSDNCDRLAPTERQNSTDWRHRGAVSARIIPSTVHPTDGG